MASKTHFFILTGDPGIGKTTLIKKLVSSLSQQGIKTSGFYTEELRRNGIREGFDVISLDGARGSLARDCSLLTGSTKFKVGKYGVLVQEFEDVALPSLENTQLSNILVIDEIGKMEFFSTIFKAKIKEIFSQPRNLVLCTIPVRKSDPLIENIRNGHNVKLWTVTRINRNTVKDEILSEIEMALQKV